MTEQCPGCGTATINAPGIGPYCPNRACGRLDDLGAEPSAPPLPIVHTATFECVGDAEYALVFSDEARIAFGLHVGDDVALEITDDHIVIRRVAP